MVKAANFAVDFVSSVLIESMIDFNLVLGLSAGSTTTSTWLPVMIRCGLLVAVGNWLY